MTTTDPEKIQVMNVTALALNDLCAALHNYSDQKVSFFISLAALIVVNELAETEASRGKIDEAIALLFPITETITESESPGVFTADIENTRKRFNVPYVNIQHHRCPLGTKRCRCKGYEEKL